MMNVVTIRIITSHMTEKRMVVPRRGEKVSEPWCQALWEWGSTNSSTHTIHYLFVHVNFLCVSALDRGVEYHCGSEEVKRMAIDVASSQMNDPVGSMQSSRHGGEPARPARPKRWTTKPIANPCGHNTVSKPNGAMYITQLHKRTISRKFPAYMEA